MKKIKTIIHIALALTAAGAEAQQAGQPYYAPVLEQIEQHSVALEAAGAEAEAQRAASRTGLAPTDPEVEFGYLWGNPSAEGDRRDVSVRQAFDLPTAYRRRLRRAEGAQLVAETAYRTERMAVLLKARRLCAEMVYCNALTAIYQAQAAQAGQLEAAYARMTAAGEASLLDLNKARLHHTRMEAEMRRLHTERARIAAELAAMNGGRAVILETADYGPRRPLPAAAGAWLAEAEATHPELRLRQAEAEVAERQASVVRAERLPRLTLGYMGEFVAGQHLQGITAGVSVPLWENRHRVQQARSEARTTERRAEEARIGYAAHFEALYADALQLQSTLEAYDAALADGERSALLEKAFATGEISLLTYLTELEYELTARAERLAAERDLELVLAELEAFRL